MITPKKSINQEKDTTFFGELEKNQAQVKKLSARLSQEMVVLKNLTNEFQAIQKEGKYQSEQSKTKLMIEVKILQEKIKNSSMVQKAQYMRSANQINSIIANSKEVNAHLTLLSSKLNEFQKNVGL